VSNTVIFLVPLLTKDIAHYAWFFRFLYAFRTQAGKQRFFVMLKNTSEFPEVIHAVLQYLWHRQTGRHHSWNPNMSDEFNRAMREVSEATELMVAGKFENPESAYKVVNTVTANNEGIPRELKSRLRIRTWISWGILSAFVVYLVALLARRLF
jgi:hypothetical protein